MRRMYPAKEVRWRSVEDAVVILDLRTEGYFILDPVGSAMWEAALAGADVVTALGRKTGADPERIRADFDAFLSRAKARGFLADTPSSATAGSRCAPGGRRAFLALRAWWSLFRTTRRLAGAGFRAIYEEIAAIPNPRNSEDGEERLSEAVAAFARAENFFHMKRAPQDCLPRSLALCRFLRSVGVPAEHCIGVRRFPFGGHAWVEQDGRAVNEDEEQLRAFSVVSRVTS